MTPSISIVLRTLNESKHLQELLETIHAQNLGRHSLEVVVVDSGSSDNTLEIATNYNCRIVHIAKDEFTFGRSLNIGCDAAKGEYLIFISGHCIPVNHDWAVSLIAPLCAKSCAYSYGKQIGRDTTKFSETRVFKKYFPDTEQIPQKGFFCNNANSAISKTTWSDNPFNETLTGLEDMELAKRLEFKGNKIGYVASAPVYHIHDESWKQVERRYEREAIALQEIMPEVHVTITDFLRYFASGVLMDMGDALGQSLLKEKFFEIIMFRFMQYYGTYKGNHQHRKLSNEKKLKYFYPNIS